jgi:outer membrane receptor for ferrienterochelin and colicins
LRRIFIVGLLLLATSAGAQTPCADALVEAQKSYDLGQFEDVPGKLEPCLTGRLSRAVAIQVHTLLVRTYLQSDEPETARKEVSAILRLDPTFEAPSPPRFAALVAEVRREEQTTQVASVSKTNESLREAPATVVVVTAEEIQRRGYLDLEQLLHDLPGFDISRLNGDIYSNIYQRGYRSPNDRLLLLVDGVEQNELSSGIVYLSRQYPLTNIDRVEVIYGPASTMYGANAYTGVISILTKEPEKLAGENRSFGVTGQVTGGGYESRIADVTLAGRDASGTMAWSVAANVQQSKERDLSGFADWDYTFQNIDYLGETMLFDENAGRFYEQNCGEEEPATQFFNCVDQFTIELTPEGEALVRRLDQDLIRQQGLGFDDRSENWSFYGKFRLANLTAGLQMWRSREGVASQYLARDISGRSSFTPRQTSLYVKYSLPLERVRANFFTRYMQSSIERSGSKFEYMHGYLNYLDIASLVAPCGASADQIPQDCAPAKPWVETVTFGSVSTQLRSEFNVVFPSSAAFDGVAGLEFAKSSIQSQLEQVATGPGQLFHELLIEPGQIEHTDIALYGQGSWKPRPSLKFVMAGRLTHNQINNRIETHDGDNGFGTLFTPRAGVIYSPGDKRLVLKAIYSEAFKDPTDAQKFGVVTGVNDFPADDELKPERVRNTELSAGWEPVRGTSVETSLYEARYSDVVSLGSGICSLAACRQYRNRDEIRIRGLQATARVARTWGEVWGNYTWTDPFLTNPKDEEDEPLPGEQRVADIARDRVNAGVEVNWASRLNAGLRLHYVGARKTGEGTTELHSPFTELEAHMTADAVVGYTGLVPGATLQLIVYNLFDKQYFDPASDPQVGAARVPQAGRTVYLRLSFAGRDFARQ